MESLDGVSKTKLDVQNGHATHSKASANGSATSKPEASIDADHPGLIQLAICVGGIYASLYGFSSLCYVDNFANVHPNM